MRTEKLDLKKVLTKRHKETDVTGCGVQTHHMSVLQATQ